jgi:hypothetical protein
MWECVAERRLGHFRYSERSSLHDVRYHAFGACLASRLASPTCNQIRICFLTDEIQTRFKPDWWSQTGSNRRPPACKAGALPAELWPQKSISLAFNLRPAAKPRSSEVGQRRLVGLGRFELPTSRLSSARSNQLSYKP